MSELATRRAEMLPSELSAAILMIALPDQDRRQILRSLDRGLLATGSRANVVDHASDKATASTHGHPVGSYGEASLTVLAAQLTETDLALVAVAGIALDRCKLEFQMTHEMLEHGSLSTIATRILAARSIDEALAAVTHEARSLLNSDIGGVMLGDGEEIVMRGCAGNQRVETARLRMRRGQGLAGLVLSTGEPERVDDYVASVAISNDFHSLAHSERVHCAMGAPIRVGVDVIGVLEVWRREAVPYTDVDSARLASLADLAAIAFENARLHETNKVTLLEVESARQSLELQFSAKDRALQVQQRLLESLIGASRLGELLRVISDMTNGRVHLLDADLEHLASHPADAPAEAIIAALRHDQRHRLKRTPHTVSWIESEDLTLAVEDVTVGNETVGFLCLETETATDDPALSLILTQAALACALQHLQEQAGTRARAHLREELLAELLDGTNDTRRAAMSRAKQIGVDVRGTMRVLLVSTESARQGDASQARRAHRAISELLAEHNLSRGLSSVRENAIVFLIRSPEIEQLRSNLSAAASALLATTPSLQLGWGLSGPCLRPAELDRALREAETALRLNALSADRAMTFFDDLGIIGLLLGGPQDDGMKRFVHETLGGIIDYDQSRGSELVLTLSTYLDRNCSQQECAAQLFIHQKTVKYRLNLVEKLTGLDLSTHRDRVLSEVAIRALSVS